MVKRLVIAIDCDDVLVEVSPHIVEYYNKTHGAAIGLHHMYGPVVPEAWGTDDKDVAINRIHDYLRTDEHAAIQPSQEAIDAVKDLAERHELHLVTGRADFLEPVTRRMLEAYFPGCFQTIEHTNYLNPSTDAALRRTKGEVCRTIGADILIDDHIKHGESALQDVEEVILFGDYPWNQCEALPERMVRCVDWGTTIEEIEASARH